MATNRRYTTPKTIAEIGPEWARGCANCSHGIISAPDITGATSFYLERLVQALDGDVHFCSCQAGVAYRASLLNRRQFLVEEARKHPKMREHATNRTHPDIEGAQMAVHAARVPTVHADVPVTEPVMEPA
jgi:hypothetical protein